MSIPPWTERVVHLKKRRVHVHVHVHVHVQWIVQT